MTANMFADTTTTTTSGYGLIPPPQSLVEDVQITFDTDMMDEDEALAYQQQQQQQSIDETGLMANGATIGFDTDDGAMGMDTDTVQIVAEKVHLRGVDTMATGDIEVWVRTCVGDGEEGQGGLVRVQWIDDSSCNLIFPTADYAKNALDLLTEPNPPMAGGVTQPTPAQQQDLLLIRAARIPDAHPNARLEVRIARADDVKQKGARERSRFYLFNPEYDRREEYERKRRSRKETRRDNRDRDRDVSPPTDGDYQRRRYDHREHERRIAGTGDAAMYTDNMYDDDDTTPRLRARRRTRSRSRSHSTSRSRYHSRHRSPPPRRRWHSRSRSRTPPRRGREKNIELFPETMKPEPKGLMGHHGEDRFYNPPMETVSRIDDGAEVGKIPTRVIKGIELFPEKLGSAPLPPMSSASRRRDLAARITLPGVSSVSGILGYHSDSGVGSEDTPVVIKGRGAMKAEAEDDLFAEKMASGRRVGLGRGGGDLFDRIEMPEGIITEGGGGGGRRRGRRSKAADLFG